MASPVVKATIQAAALSALSNVLAQLLSCYRDGKSYHIDAVPLAHFVIFSLISCPPNFYWQTWLEDTYPGYTAAAEPGTTTSIAQDTNFKRVAEKTAPALQALNEKATTTASAIGSTGVIQDIKRRATEGVETVKAKAKEYEARSGLNIAANKASDLITPLTFSTADGKTIEKKTDKTSTSKTGDGSKKLNLKNTAIKFTLDQTVGAVVNNVLFIAGIGALRGEAPSSVIASVRSDLVPLLFAGQKLWPLVSIISFTVIPVEQRTVFGSIVGVGWGIFLSLVAGGKE